MSCIHVFVAPVESKRDDVASFRESSFRDQASMLLSVETLGGKRYHVMLVDYLILGSHILQLSLSDCEP